MEKEQPQQANWPALKMALSALSAEEVANFLVHGGNLAAAGGIEAAIFGGAIAAIAGWNAPPVLRHLLDSLPHSEELKPFELLTRKDASGRSVVDRLMGHYPTEEELQTVQPLAATGMEDLPMKASTLNLAPTLRPHVNALFGARTGIFGLPGAGKSNTIAVLLEELGEYACPLLILDTENENAQICTSDYFMNPNRESAASITPENAYDWGKSIMDCNLQVVLNLQSYATDDAAAQVMVSLVAGINDWEEEQTMRVPCAIVLDEAHKWLPQQAGMSPLSKEKDDDGLTLLQKVQQCFLGTVASRGRKRGMGLIFASQRLAMLDKDLIMCNWLFLLRQTLPNDLKTYKDMGCPPEIAQSLENGQAYVITPTRERSVHQIRKRFSASGADTPGLEELEAYKRSRQKVARPAAAAEGDGQRETEPLPMTRTLSPTSYEQMAITLLQHGYTLEQVIGMQQAASSKVAHSASGSTTEKMVAAPEKERRASHFDEPVERYEADTEPIEASSGDEQLSELEKRVLDLLLQGRSQKQIIQEIWNTSGGDKYVRASAEVQQIIQKLVAR